MEADTIINTRDTFFRKSKRIVVKVGSAVLTHNNSMNLEAVDNIAHEISYLHGQGREVVLVSSGAVAAGRKKLAISDKHDISLEEKQALAAVGQSHLMHLYDEIFLKYNKNIAQLLITHSDLSHRKRYLNFKNTLFTLLKMGVIPIINENDTVSTEELQFGDNDTLGALVTNLIEGDMFICLTDVNGLYTGNPETDKTAKPIFTVKEITPQIEAMASHSTSLLGTGGMRSKISAASKVASGGAASIIGPGKENNIIQRIFNGEKIGTFFLPKRKKLQGKKQWIAFVLKPKGKIFLDNGAENAICSGGKSLLPSGVIGVEGDFFAGESVECIDQQNKVVATGLANYRAEEIKRLIGVQSSSIAHILGYKDSDEIIHRDNLVIL